MNEGNFTVLFDEGNKALCRGDFGDAIDLFFSAAVVAQGNDNKVIACHNMGICLRLNNQFYLSELVFEFVIRNAHDVILEARIKRDLGMCYLDHANSIKKSKYAKSFKNNVIAKLCDDAEGLFISSRDVLKLHGEIVEAAVSDGFLGRLCLLKKQNYNALHAFKRSHYVLNGSNDTYELNNLVWLARASFICRWRYAIKVYGLAKRTAASRRWKEYLIILIGGNFLYEKVATLMRR